jgi:16S rRNA processing protein RimM
MSPRIAVGVIRKPHGIRGEASVEPWTDSADRFSELHDVSLVSPDESEIRQTTIETTRVHLGRALVKFKGIDGPDEVSALRGWTIEIPEADARPLGDNEYFLHDLIGMRVVDDNGNERGTVTDAYEGGGGLLLTVKRGAREFDVPFAAEICTGIDVASKTITVKLPDGLDDLENVAD